MDFKDFRKEEKKLGLGGEFFRPQQGESKVRILTAAEPIGSHFKGKGGPPGICTLGDDCGYCRQNIKKTVKVWIYVLDREDETIKLGELPWSVFKQTGELGSNSEHGYKDLPPYDLLITRTGEGMGTKYSVMPTKNPLSVDYDALEFESNLTDLKIEFEQANEISIRRIK